MPAKNANNGASSASILNACTSSWSTLNAGGGGAGVLNGSKYDTNSPTYNSGEQFECFRLANKNP